MKTANMSLTSNEFETFLQPDEYNVVYVDVPEIELDENNKVILSDSCPNSQKDSLFQVPPAIIEETIETYPTESFPVPPNFETDPTAIVAYQSDLTSVPNSPRAKISVRKFATIANNETDTTNSALGHIAKSEDDADYFPQVKKAKDRRKQVFPKFTNEKPILTTCSSQNNSKPPAFQEIPQQPKDLMWLLNFKLDNFLQENPLDAVESGE